MQYILLSIYRLAIRRERSAESFGPDQLNSGATDFNDFGPTLSRTMKYTSYILALQLCVILGSSSCYSQSTILNETEKLKRYFKRAFMNLSKDGYTMGIKQFDVDNFVNATSPDIANGGRLFLDILTNWEGESDIKIIQSQIVSFYFKLFEKIEDNNTIQNSLNIIKEELRVKVFNSSNSKMEDFKKLIQIPVNDLRVQRKAISELHNVIKELSKPNPKMRKRRQNLFRGWRA